MYGDESMSELSEISQNIETLQKAQAVLQSYYQKTEFHKQREHQADTAVPPSPDDEDVFKLLTAIQQIEKYVKKLQDEQFQLLQQEEA